MTKEAKSSDASTQREEDDSRWRGLVFTHGAALRAAFDAAVQRYGRLDVAFATFASRILGRTFARLARLGKGTDRADVGGILETCAAADLFLVLACEAADERAWMILHGQVLAEVREVLRRRGLHETAIDEECAELPGYLFLKTEGVPQRSRLQGYDGLGSLVGWLAVVAQRRALDRRRSRRVAPLDDLAEGPAAAVPREEAGVERAESIDAVRQAVAVAWTRMTGIERRVARSRLALGLSQKAIARLVGVGEPRVSMLMKRALGRLQEAVEARFDRSTGLSDALAGILRENIADCLRTLGSDARHEDDGDDGGNGV